MKFIGTTLGNHIYDAAGGLAELSRVVVGLYFEFLNCIRGRTDGVCLAGGETTLVVIVVCAIERIVLVLRGLPADRGASGRIDGDAWSKRDELLHVPAIKRQLRNQLCVDDLSDRGILRLQNRLCTGDDDLFCGGTHCQGNEYIQPLLNLKLQSSPYLSLKSRCIDGDVIFPHLHRCKNELAVLIGGAVPYFSCAFIL